MAHTGTVKDLETWKHMEHGLLGVDRNRVFNLFASLPHLSLLFLSVSLFPMALPYKAQLASHTDSPVSVSQLLGFLVLPQLTWHHHT